MEAPKILTRDFVYTFLAQFLFSLAFFILIPTLPVYLSQLKARESEIGVLIGVFSVSSLIFRPLVGRSLSKISERRFMLAGVFLFIFCSILYQIAPPFWPFLVLRILHGVSLALFFTAAVTLIANISPETHRGQSLSYFFLTYNIAFAIAPTLGMFLIQYLSFFYLFLTTTILSLITLSFTIPLKKRPIDPADAAAAPKEPLISWQTLPVGIVSFFSHTIWGAVTAFFPLYAIDHGMSNPGLFFAVFALMLILGRTLGARIFDLYSRERVIFPCLILFVLSMALLTVSKSVPMFLLVAVLWGAGNAFLFPSLVALTLDLTGPSRGPAMGTFTALSDLGAALGAVMMGLVLRISNYQTMFLCLVLSGLVNFFYFNFHVRKKIRNPVSDNASDG